MGYYTQKEQIMVQVNVQPKSFTNDEGKVINYKVLAINGTIEGLEHTLEIKVSKTEAMLAEILLNSNGEPAEITTRKATKEEQDDFLSDIDD